METKWFGPGTSSSSGTEAVPARTATLQRPSNLRFSPDPVYALRPLGRSVSRVARTPGSSSGTKRRGKAGGAAPSTRAVKVFAPGSADAAWSSTRTPFAEPDALSPGGLLELLATGGERVPS